MQTSRIWWLSHFNQLYYLYYWNHNDSWWTHWKTILLCHWIKSIFHHHESIMTSSSRHWYQFWAQYSHLVFLFCFNHCCLFLIKIYDFNQQEENFLFEVNKVAFSQSRSQFTHKKQLSSWITHKKQFSLQITHKKQFSLQIAHKK